MKIYILYGTWGNNETDGTDVLMVSDSSEPVEKRLEEIADGKACEFLKTEGDGLIEDRGFRYYEASDHGCGYARFYIAEKDLRLSAGTIWDIYSKTERSGRLADIKEDIVDLADNIPAWKCWYASHDQGTLNRILAQMDKHESCNVAYNDTLRFAVTRVLDNIRLDDDVLARLWEMFGDVPVDDDKTLDAFMGYPAGTDRIEIWHWFDEHFTDGLGIFLERKDKQLK